MKFAYPPDAKPVDGYTIRRGIHRGGFGEVYYAVSDAGKEVALKLLTNDLDTELRGIRQCLNLKHPNLITLFDVKQDAEGDTWVVMEYVSGASLEDVLNAFPKGLPLSEVRDWMAGILAGTEYLHGRGIVHRDLKPANIYRENGTVKIGDVGLSKQMGGTRRQHTEAVGTVYYMAPEVARGQYGAEVDIYSLGVILFELLTGRLPFDGETTAEILMKHLATPPDLTPIPAALRPVLARTLEKDPAKRIHSVRQFAEEFFRLVPAEPLPHAGVDPTATTSGPRSQAERPTMSCGQASRETPHAASPVFPPEGSANAACGGIVGDVLAGVRARFRESFDQAMDREWAHRVPSKVSQVVRSSIDRALEKERRRHARRVQKALDKEQRRHDERLRKAATGKKSSESYSYREWNNWGWWPYAVLALILFMPWHKWTQGDVLEQTGILAFWGLFLFSLDYITRPERWTEADEPQKLPLAQPESPSISGIEQVARSWLLATGAATFLVTVGILSWSKWQPHYVLETFMLQDYLWQGLTVILGTVAVVTATLFTSPAPSPDSQGHRQLSFGWTLVGVGCVLGFFVSGLAEFLETRTNPIGPARPMWSHIGQFRMQYEGHSTAAAYMLFFALILWLQKWDQNLRPERPYWIRLGPVVWAAAAGWGAAWITGVPVPYSVLWSTVITASAQAAAPWQPRKISTRIPVTTAV